MTFWQKNRLHNSKWTLTDVAHNLWGPTLRDSMLQWGTAGLVGFCLGIYSIIFWVLPSKWALLTIPVVLAPFVMMVLGQVRRLLLAAILLDIPFQLDIYLDYKERAIGGAINGLVVSVTTLALIGLYALWLAELLAKPRKKQSRPLFGLMFPLSAYLAIATFSIIVAQDTRLSIFGIFLLVQMFLFYVYLVGTIHTREDIMFIVMMLLIGLTLESLLMIGLRVIGHSIEIGGVMNARIDRGVRVGGTVGSPNGTAAYLSLVMVPALSVMFTQLNRYYKWLSFVAFSLGLIALLLTLSRGGWLSLSFSIGLLGYFVWRRGWLSPAVCVVGILLALIPLFIFQEAIIDRLWGDDNGSAESRIPLMIVAFKMILDNPILGVGINNFTVRLLEYARLETASFWIYSVHNTHLLILAETGIFAFMAYSAFLGATLYRGWQCWALKDRMLSPLALGFAIATLGHMVHMLFDILFGRPQLQLLWLGAGLIAIMHSISIETQSFCKQGDLSPEERTRNPLQA